MEPFISIPKIHVHGKVTGKVAERLLENVRVAPSTSTL